MTAKADWAASLMPRGPPPEQRIVDDARQEYTWLRDRARRAQEARLATNIVNAGVDEAIREADEVRPPGTETLLGQSRPAGQPRTTIWKGWEPRVRATGFLNPILPTIPKTPSALVLPAASRQPAAASGCSTAGRRLRSILEEGLDWQSGRQAQGRSTLGPPAHGGAVDDPECAHPVRRLSGDPSPEPASKSPGIWNRAPRV